MKARPPLSYCLFLIIFTILLTSCEKKEQAVTLPPKGSAEPGTVEMGENYDNQIFFSFETNQPVFTSRNDSWDLAFEAGSDGYHVFMNGGKNNFIYNTHVVGFSALTVLPAACSKQQNWLFDASCGLPDSTAVGEWKDGSGKSNNEVFILQYGTSQYKKFVLTYVSGTKYSLQYGDLQDTIPKILDLPKDSAYNFIYYSVANGIVSPEPPKNSWDVVFTRYRYVYHELHNFTYLLNGVLLNPWKTSAACDSIQAFSTITADIAATFIQSRNRDVIGFDWKTYNFNTSHYDVNRGKNYILHTINNQVFKLHFLDFYSNTGVKGSPSFESERLQ